MNDGFMDDLEIIQSLNIATQNFQKFGSEIEKNLREFARIYRFAFKGLMAQGFSEEQALEIIKARGPFLQ